MSRSRSVCPALALFLAALLAWPWNLALADADSSALSPQSNHGAWVARSSRTRQVSRFGKCSQAACPAVAPDFEESEEGGAASPSQTAALLLSCAVTTERRPTTGWDADGAGLRTLVPIGIHCRLRC